MITDSARLEALAADLDILNSALSAGLDFSDSVLLLAARSSMVWRREFEFLKGQVANQSSVVALGQLKAHAENVQIDRLVETLLAHLQYGGFSLTAALADQARQCRDLARVLSEASSRVRAVLMLTRLGAVSPFVMLILLSARDENRAAFLSPQGLGVILGGTALVAFAYVMVSRAARITAAPRGLAS